MKIAVVDLVSLDGGGYHITKNLFDYVSSGRAGRHEWLFVVSKQRFESNRFAKVVHFPKGAEGYWKRAVTESTSVNRCLHAYGAEIVVSMPNIRVIGCRLKQIVYMQQPIPFQNEKRFSFLKAEERSYAFRQSIQGWAIKKSLTKAEAVFVQTNWVKQAVEAAIHDVPVIKIGYPAGSSGDQSAPKAARLNADFFYPCGPAIYKNVPVIIKAVNRLKAKGLKPRFFITLTIEEMKILGKEDFIDPETFLCLGRIAHSRVRELYARTTLVFSSYIETLGLPLVEAREAGTWIIASDCAFSQEVLEEYPNREFFPPADDRALAECMERVLLKENKLVPWQESTAANENCWRKMIRYIERQQK